MSDKFQDDVRLREDNPSRFGDKLKSTRETMGLSVQEAASRLHLSPRFITLLESDDLEQCQLPSIYLRGYLRSYTRLLGIPEQELAKALEKLNPLPPALDPLPAASAEALPLSFSLGKNPYYARIATVLISVALLTCITAWWQLHANNSTPTVIALEQAQTNPETVIQSSVEVTPPVAPLLNNNPLLEAAASPNTEVANAPTSAIDLTATKPVALASTGTEQNTHTLTPAPAAKQSENDDDSVDEQE